MSTLWTPSTRIVMRRPRGWCAGLALLLAAGAAGAAFVYETDTEFLTSGDLDGDGRVDAVIVDRAAGTFTVGYQTNSRAFFWSPPRPGGIVGVTGVSLGRIVATSRDALVLTSPDANRLNVFDAAGHTQPAVPLPVYPHGVGPSQVVALDIGGTGNLPARDDLYVWTEWNGGANPYRLALMRNTASGAFTNIDVAVFADDISGANRVAFDAAEPDMAVVLSHTAGADVLRVQTLTNGTLRQVLAVGSLPIGTRYAVGTFGADTLCRFFTYVPGSETLAVHRVTFNGVNYGASRSAMEMVQPIRQVFVVADHGTNKVVIVYGDGDTAKIYASDGTGLSWMDTLAPAAGKRFTGVIPGSGLDFQLLSGDPTNRLSSSAEYFRFGRGYYTRGSAQSLPAPSAETAHANVILFEDEPFVSFHARRRDAFRAGDWTTGFLSPGGGEVDVTHQRDQGVISGLSGATVSTLQPAQRPPDYGLINQMGASFSVCSFDPAFGPEFASLTIEPPSGFYDTAIEVTLTSEPGRPINCRLGNTSIWSPYNGPFFLYRNTTVHCFAGARDASAVVTTNASDKSRIFSATYTFAADPSDMDADGDGVPDYVEIAYGLDPVESGADGDGDGRMDFEEILGMEGRDDRGARGDWLVMPLPYHGVLGSEMLARTGTLVRAHDLFGVPMGSAESAPALIPVLGVTSLVARLANLPADPQPALAVLTTPPHFAIDTGNTNCWYGREMVGVYTADAVPPVEVDYEYVSGRSTNAACWVIAARAAYDERARQSAFRTLRKSDTLVALLFERQMGDLLYYRGLAAQRTVSLFPFRDGDSWRDYPTPDSLQSLEHHPWGAYRAEVVFTNLYHLIYDGHAPQLSGLVTELYRISSVYHGVTNGLSNTVYRLPVDVLRDFLLTGALDATYTNRSTLTPEQLQTARSQAGELLAQPPIRPLETLSLVTRTNSFGADATTLWNADGRPYCLYRSPSRPYLFPQAVTMPTGTTISVTGYTDLTALGVVLGAIGVEVVSIGVTSILLPSETDADGNLMNDGWERFCLGMTGSDPWADSDDDGYQNIQEALEMTDGGDFFSIPAVNPVHFGLPQLQMMLMPSGNIMLHWDWPDTYSYLFRMTIEDTDNLLNGFQYHSDAMGPWVMIMSKPEATSRFFRVRIAIR